MLSEQHKALGAGRAMLGMLEALKHGWFDGAIDNDEYKCSHAGGDRHSWENRIQL